MNGITLHCGDCRDLLPTLAENSIDSCVTDPPYHLTSTNRGSTPGSVAASHDVFKRVKAGGFMGKQWDGGDIAFRPETWAAVYRVLKPGAHLIAFSGTRTYHRMVCAIEDAGFEVRDQIGWAFGSGFPKSHNIAVAIDRANGIAPRSKAFNMKGRGDRAEELDANGREFLPPYEPATDAAREWEGWGTALKPAYEPILLCCKPLTVSQLIGIAIEAISRELLSCRTLNADDAERLFSGIRAKLKEVGAHSVLDSARTRALESIDSASFAELLSICPSLASADRTRTPEGSVPTNARVNGNQRTTSENETPHGKAGDFSSTLTDIITSVLRGDTSENIATSWSKFSVAALSEASTFTTATATKLIIDLRTLRSLLLPTISDGTGNFSPNWQSIVVARKPLSEPTIAANVLKWGTGAINVDGCRVGTSKDVPASPCTQDSRIYGKGASLTNGSGDGFNPNIGRWPSNLIHDGSKEVVGAFPESEGNGGIHGTMGGGRSGGIVGDKRQREYDFPGYGDSGSAARFFYTAKADGMDRLGSRHPTVKPVDLIQYLVRLVTPKGGTSLDPFAGTGTLGEACIREGMKAVLIEREEEYQEDIRRRMKLAMAGPDERSRESAKARNATPDLGPLFERDWNEMWAKPYYA